MTFWGDVPRYPAWEAPIPELQVGDRVAWTETAYGMTDALSEIHRVYDDHTYCGAWIPDGSRHLSRVLFKGLDACRSCQSLYAQDQAMRVSA